MEGNATANAAPAALEVPAFDARHRLAQIHAAITDFLHYQSHVRLFASTSLPSSVPGPDDAARLRILALLAEEQRYLALLRYLIEATEANDRELIRSYQNAEPVAGPHAWGN